MKTCINCQETKDHSEFWADKRSRDGLQSYCKTCSKERGRQRYLARQGNVMLRASKYRLDFMKAGALGNDQSNRKNQSTTTEIS